MYDAIVTPLFIGHLALVFLPGSHVSGSHWIPVCMINIRPPMHSLDWPMASYIRQSLLLLWEKALVSVITQIERVRYYLIEPSNLYKG